MLKVLYSRQLNETLRQLEGVQKNSERLCFLMDSDTIKTLLNHMITVLKHHDSAPATLVNLCKEQHSEVRAKLVEVISIYETLDREAEEAKALLSSVWETNI